MSHIECKHIRLEGRVFWELRFRMICDVDYMCKSPRDRVTRTKVENSSSSYHKPNSWHTGGSSQQAASKAEGTLSEELNDSSRTRKDGAADRCCLCPVVRMLHWRTLSLKSHGVFLLPSGSFGVFIEFMIHFKITPPLSHTQRKRGRKQWGGTRPDLYTGRLPQFLSLLSPPPCFRKTWN